MAAPGPYKTPEPPKLVGNATALTMIVWVPAWSQGPKGPVDFYSYYNVNDNEYNDYGNDYDDLDDANDDSDKGDNEDNDACQVQLQQCRGLHQAVFSQHKHPLPPWY